MDLFRVYASMCWRQIEFGIAFYFPQGESESFEIGFLLGPLSIGIVFGETKECPPIIMHGDTHVPIREFNILGPIMNPFRKKR